MKTFIVPVYFDIKAKTKTGAIAEAQDFVENALDSVLRDPDTIIEAFIGLEPEVIEQEEQA